MNNIEEIKAECAAKIAKAEREIAIRATLPADPSTVCIHSDSVSLSFEKPGYRGKFTLAEAVYIYRKFLPFAIDGEHWKDGSVSTLPGPINSNEKKESGTMDGSHHAEIKLHSFGSRGEYQECELRFWVLIGADYCEVSIRFNADWKWMPDRRVTFNNHGEVARFSLTPKFIGEDSRRSWWSEKPGYSLSYYWADVHNFAAFLSNHLKPEQMPA